MQSIGLLEVGDYRVRRKLPHFARLFVSADGQIAGEIALSRLLGRSMRAASLFSLLDDRTFAETGDKCLAEGAALLSLRGLPGGGAAELLAVHRDYLHDISVERGVSPVALDVNDLPLVAVYGAALLHQLFIRRQIVDSRPYDDSMPRIYVAIERLMPQPIG